MRKMRKRMSLTRWSCKKMTIGKEKRVKDS